MVTTQPARRGGAASPPPEALLTHLLFGGLLQQSIRVAAALGIADLVAGQPQSAAALAAATRTHAPSLYRVLRTLASVGIFAEDADRRFALTPMAALLRRDAPNSLRDFAILQGEEWNWRGVGAMPHAVATGGTAQAHVHGMELFAFLARRPEDEALFNRAMTSYSLAAVPAIVEACAFSGVRRLADIGGGHGILLAGILRAHPRMDGVLFDLPSVLAGAAELLEREGVRPRVDLVAGDFFEAVPAGADAYILKNILHDWDDERAATILHNVRAAMDARGKVLLVELVVPATAEPSLAKLVDLQMLVTMGGKERTEAEYSALLAASGFRLTGLVPTKSPLQIIEAAPV